MSETYVYYHVTRPGAVLHVTGPDAFAFLQSQFSNDLNNPGVDPPIVTYGLWLDHKGKIQADSFVLEKSREDFFVVSYDGLAALRAHLESRLIADEVTLTDETENYYLLHLWPTEMDADLSQLVERLATVATCESWIGRRPTVFGALDVTGMSTGGAWPRFRRPVMGQWFASWDILATPEAMEKLVGELHTLGIAAASAEELRALRVAAAVPAIPADVGPGDLPQEAGLQLAALSFDKGCYLGQEVMSRIHTQGHVNRALWQVAWEGDPLPQETAPTPLYLDQEEAGELRSHVNKDGMNLGLAMLKKRIILGQRELSFTPNGEKVVGLVRDLTEA